MHENSKLQCKHNLYEPKFPHIQLRGIMRKTVMGALWKQNHIWQSDKLPLLVSTNNLLLEQILSIMSRPNLEKVHHYGKESKQEV